jgi:hypothetical protein
MRRWKSLRDRYTREIKKEKLPSGRRAKSQSPWHLLYMLYPNLNNSK